MANIGATYEVELENEVVRLFEVDGLSISKIIAATGVRERRVKQLIKGKVKGKKFVTTNVNSKVDKVALLAYSEAVSERGLTDDRLRTLAHSVYGTTWNPVKGKYESNLERKEISRVKIKLRTMASVNDDAVKLLPSWMNPAKATECREWLESFATEMQTRFSEGVSEFMERFAIDVADSDEGDRVLSRQYYSAMRHVKALSTGLGAEPVRSLLERTKVISDEIDGMEDLPAPIVPRAKRQLIPEPKRECYDAFFGEIERLKAA